MKDVWTRAARYAAVALLGSALPIGPSPASAQSGPVVTPPTWGGDVWSRPRLTGDWGGLRDELGKKGVALDVDALLMPQSVASGGKDTGTEFWGNATYTLNVDSDKLGLWPGARTTNSGSPGRARNSATTLFPPSARPSISVSTTRTRSRCTTTLRSRRG